MRKIRAVISLRLLASMALDSMVLEDGEISPARSLFDSLIEGHFNHFLSTQTAQALGEYLLNVRFDNHPLASTLISDYVSLISNASDYVPVSEISQKLRPDFDYILATAAKSNASYLILHDDEANDQSLIEAMDKRHAPISVIAFNTLLEDLDGIFGDDDSSSVGISPVEASIRAQASYMDFRNRWEQAVAMLDFAGAAAAFARLLSVPQLPSNFDYGGWQNVREGSVSDTQLFQCLVIGRNNAREEVVTVNIRLNVRATDPESIEIRKALYDDFSAAVKEIRVLLNVIT